MSRKPIQPPPWWEFGLYFFLSNISLKGWIWEFFRRAMLQQELSRPVDAMNSSPDLADLDPHYRNCYKHWTHKYWFDKNGNRRETPIFVPPAVFLDKGWPMGFKGQQYRIDDHNPHFVNIKIDMNRRDTDLRRDFKLLLRKLRKNRPKTKKRITPKPANWKSNYILEVWDLRQFKVSWNMITDLIADNESQIYDRKAQNNIDDKDIKIAYNESTQNAYRTAKSYIDAGNWKELMYYVSSI